MELLLWLWKHRNRAGVTMCRGDFHLRKVAPRRRFPPETAPQLFVGWDTRNFHLLAIPAWMQGTWWMLTTRGEFQGGLGSSGIPGADISNWLPRAVWLLPICSRWEVSIQWISPLLTSSEPGLWEEWTPSGRNRLHLLSCKTSSYKFPEPSRTAEDRGRSNLDLHWIPYHCLPPLNLHGELLQANKRKTDNQTDKQAKRFPRIWLWFGIASLMAQQVKNPLAMQEAQETWVWSLSWEVPLEKSMAAHSSVLSWEILWTKEPSGPQSIASQRVGHDWATEHTHRAPWSSKKYRLEVTLIITLKTDNRKVCKNEQLGLTLLVCLFVQALWESV